ncbi:MAG TPA: hypothetical protein VIS48_06795 [Candidatus Kryptonia bacterium]
MREAVGEMNSEHLKNYRWLHGLRVREGGMKFCKLITLVLSSIFLLANVKSYLQERAISERKNYPRKILGSSYSTVLNTNNITAWVQDDGLFPPKVPRGQNEWNGEFRKGSGVGVIFQEGIVFGGLVHDNQPVTVRICGSAYGTGMQAGKILSDASGNVTGAENPSDLDVRIWRVRSDVRPGQTVVPGVKRSRYHVDYASAGLNRPDSFRQ